MLVLRPRSLKHSYSLDYREELKQRKLVRMDSNVALSYPTQLIWNVTRDVIQHTDMARFQMDR